ncbi:MAG TPA: hypothetical protein VNJ51_03505 [Candidatus Dormibacteraeota bacterium]|nr:hypothetical protein [Candidatus Dormibacteraeota bacterium]
MSDAVYSGDISPATLPTDNATAGYTPLIYVSFYNGSTTTLTFGSTTPTVSVTDSAGFGGATTCELDVYSKNGGSALAWNAIGASGSVSGNAVTIGPVSLGAGSTVDFKPGQQILAIACK